jgi:hypothetical protein
LCVIICFSIFSSQRERRALQRLAQSLGVQFQYERAVRGQLEEQEVVQMLDTITRKERELTQAREDLQRAHEDADRYTYFYFALFILIPYIFFARY